MSVARSRPESLSPVLAAQELRLPFGVAALDAPLGGGLKRDGLHEFYAHEADCTVAHGLILRLMARLHAAEHGSLFWLRDAYATRRAGYLYTPGVAALEGLNTELLMAHLPDSSAVLRAGLDCARDGAARAIALEMWGPASAYDMLATRRLVRAAEQARTAVLVLRIRATPADSVAHSRWHVTAAPSHALRANAPGLPACTLSLLRQRGGRAVAPVVLEWTYDTDDPIAMGWRPRASLSRAVSAEAVRRECGADWADAA